MTAAPIGLPVFGIVAHEPTDHLDRLVNLLASSEARILIHIDARRTLREFSSYQGLENVSYVRDRVAVNWGAFSQVEASLAMMRVALQEPFGHLVQLSGADYPTVEPHELVTRLAAAPRTQFINLTPMPAPEIGKPITRLSRLHLYEMPRGSRRPQHLAMHAVNRLGIARRYRSRLGGRTPYAGSNWWALTEDAVREVLEVSESDRALRDLYRFSRCPDEGYIHTILGATAHGDRIAPTLTFAEWTRPTGPQPAWVDDALIDSILEARRTRRSQDARGSALILRKFKPDSASLTERVERELWPTPTASS